MEKIILRDNFGEQIILRSKLKEYLEGLQDGNDVIIDFSGVSFMSRSCADEYMKFKSESVANIKELNLSNYLEKLLAILEKRYN